VARCYTRSAVRQRLTHGLTNLNDSNARVRIAARIDRLALGNPGDVKPVGRGVSEMRIDYGPGYRVYYARTDRVVYLLLCGGTKDTRDADIKRAIELHAARAREVSAALQRKPRKRK
jgi:putative addiction module killer protein